MSAIHHATIKKAEKAGIILAQADKGYSAHWPKNNTRLNGENAKYLLDDMLTIQLMDAQFPSFKWTVNEDSTVDIIVRGTDISVTGMRATAAFGVAKKSWEQSREDLDEEDEEADEEAQAEIDEQIEEEDGPSGSVVNEKYRARYAELGHPTHCGDWLALLLKELVTNKEGTNIEFLEAIADANGVSLAKYRRFGTGWQGRLRMTARNILAKVVWLNDGELKMPETFDGGKSYKAPADWMASQHYKRDPKAAKAA